MSPRAAIWIVLSASLQVAVSATAQAPSPEPAATTPAPASAAPGPTTPAETNSVPPSSVGSPAEPAQPSPRGLQGFELLAAAGYGKSTDQAYGLELEPYGASFGFDGGYTWAFGLRIGVYLDYGLGRTTKQTRVPVIGRDIELTSDTFSLNTGLSLGHDLWLRFLILRYTWSFGATWMNWDIVTDPASPPRGYGSQKGTTTGFHMAPGIAVLWPLGRFTCGVGFDYFIQVKEQIPLGILTKLLVGVRL